MRGRRLMQAVLLLCSVALLSTGCETAGTRGELEDSTGALGRGESAKGRSSDIYVKLAIAYMRNGQMDVALQQAKKAVSIDPDSTGAHNAIALIYSRLGEMELAERHYRRGIEAEPRNPYIRNAFGTFLCQQGRYDEAEQEFVNALKNPLYRTPELAYTNAGACNFLQGSLVRAEAYLRKALQASPTFPQALVKMAKVKLQAGEYTAARGFLERYRAAARHTAESLWIGLQVERALGDSDQAASYMLQLKSGFPDAVETRLAIESEVR